MSMFDSYNLTPTNYIPDNTTESNISTPPPKLPYVAYNAQGNAIGYTWNYGDSIYLEFKITGNVVYDELGYYEDADMYLQGKKFRLAVYDSRFNEVAYCEGDASTDIKILSDSFYPSSLVKGVYTLRLTLIDEDNNILTTLFDENNGILYIR